MDTTYRNKILKDALQMRIREVTEYQVNIDNYKLAIERINDDDDEMQPFKQKLQELLASSVLEQRKAQIMLDVIKSQLK